MEDIEVDNAVSEDKARDYFIDLILGLEYCKWIICTQHMYMNHYFLCIFLL